MNSQTQGPNVGVAERVVSAAAGGRLALHGIGRIFANKRKSGLLFALAGSLLGYRGLRGRCNVYRAIGASNPPRFFSNPLSREISVCKTVTINKPAPELYAFWRDLTNLPRFMRHVHKVEMLDKRRSCWTIEAPGNRLMRFEAAIVEERENKCLSWVSSDRAFVKHQGSVSFEPAVGGRGTIVRVTLTYHPTGGAVAAMVARLFRQDPGQEIQDDLRRFKQVMETGEITTNISPTAREVTPHPLLAAAQRRSEGLAPQDRRAENEPPLTKVDIASEDSFPASDAPAWTASRR